MKDVYRFVRVTGRGERDAARNLEVTSWFLGIGSKEEMQEKDKDVKNCLFTCSQRLRREGNLGRVSAKVYGVPICTGSPQPVQIYVELRL